MSDNQRPGSTEIILLSQLPGLISALQFYEGASPYNLPSTDRAISTIMADYPPMGVYVDDSAVSVAEMLRLAQAVKHKRLHLLTNSTDNASLADLRQAGISTISTRDVTQIAAKIAELFALRRRAARRVGTVVVANGKGGSGKTTVATNIAEAFVRRGLRVLVIDTDNTTNGIVEAFRVPSGYRSYASLIPDGPSGFAVERLRQEIVTHTPSGLDLLLGPEEAEARDLTGNLWQALWQNALLLDSYDIIVVDTSPDLRRRPYPLLIGEAIHLHDSTRILVPLTSGRPEVEATRTAVHMFERSGVRPLLRFVFIAPEDGSFYPIGDIRSMFALHYADIGAAGTLPRDARAISAAAWHEDRYLSPLDLTRHSPFARGVHALAENVCRDLGIVPPKPMPKSAPIEIIKDTIARMRKSPLRPPQEGGKS